MADCFLVLDHECVGLGANIGRDLGIGRQDLDRLRLVLGVVDPDRGLLQRLGQADGRFPVLRGPVLVEDERRLHVGLAVDVEHFHLFAFGQGVERRNEQGALDLAVAKRDHAIPRIGQRHHLHPARIDAAVLELVAQQVCRAALDRAGRHRRAFELLDRAHAGAADEPQDGLFEHGARYDDRCALIDRPDHHVAERQARLHAARRHGLQERGARARGQLLHRDLALGIKALVPGDRVQPKQRARRQHRDAHLGRLLGPGRTGADKGERAERRQRQAKERQTKETSRHGNSPESPPHTPAVHSMGGKYRSGPQSDQHISHISIIVQIAE